MIYNCKNNKLVFQSNNYNKKFTIIVTLKPTNQSHDRHVHHKADITLHKVAESQKGVQNKMLRLLWIKL